MKVIIIKEFDKYKVNEIVEVADGYAKNFLIKKGIALPLNKTTTRKRKETLQDIQQKENKNLEVAKKTKEFIESLHPIMYINIDEHLVAHSSITRKQIIEYLRENKVNIHDNKNVENVKINTLGNSIVNIQIYKDISAKLTIEVRKK